VRRRAGRKPAAGRKRRAGAAGRGRAGTSRKRPESASIQIYPNDPAATVGLVPATPVAHEGGEPSYVIQGKRYAPAAYDPGTLEFQYWQGETALERTIRVWEDLFDRDFTSWHDDRPLRVRLRAGKDLNAFYDRKSLQFFYDVDRGTGRTVYAAESLDVVAHETGHAILDVYQPGYWSSVDLETAAFHEAFGDCSALLTTLTDGAVRRGLLEETGGSMRKSNLVSRLAEALGQAIYDNYGPGAVSDPTRLRDANNSFRYAAPTSLPASGGDDVLTAEPHSFSRVFTGAFYDALAWLLARALKQDASEASVESARRLAGRLLGRAVETLPPGEARFAAIAVRMRDIDQHEEGGVATIGIEEAFAGHGMRLPALGARAHRRGSARGGVRGAGTRTGVRAHARAVSPYRALRALDPDRPGGASALRAAIGIGRTARLARRTLPARVGGGVREQLVHEELVPIRHPSLGRLSGVVVRIRCGCTLTRDPGGDLEGASIAPRRDPRPAELARHVRKWARMGAICDARRGGRRSTRELFRGGTPFRVDRGGVLARVYFD
jgi:hypothetical protein